MYIDYMSEKMSNMNNQNFIKKIQTTNTILDEKMVMKPDSKIEHFSAIDPSLNYIIKRDYANIENASCIAGDFKDEANTCYTNTTVFYPTTTYLENSYTISALPYSVFDPSINKYTYYARVKTDGPGEGPAYQDYRKNNFIFSNEGNNTRDLEMTGLLERIMIKYFNNYKDYMKISKNEDISSFPNIKDMLLLKKTDEFGIPDINDILTNLITNFETTFNSVPGADLSIVNNSKLFVLIDPATYSSNIETNSVYSLIYKISISIKTANISLYDVENDKITTFEKLSDFAKIDYEPNVFNYFTYEKEIHFPIALNFSLPKKIEDGSVDLSDNKWIDNILKYANTIFTENQLFLRNKISTSSGDIIIGLTKTLNIIKTSEIINNIDKIFVLYDMNKNDKTIWNFNFIISANIDNDNNVRKTLRPMGPEFSNTYSPNFCTDSTTKLYNNDNDPKCIPICPPNYNIDLGLVCLKSGIDNYTPESDFCSKIKSLNLDTLITEKDSILYGLVQTCDDNNLSKKVVSSTTPISGVNLTNFTENGVSTDFEINEFNNVSNNFDLSKDTIQHFENYQLPINPPINSPINSPINTVRKDSKRYSIHSRPETKPIIQNNKEVKHFYPFEN
jgi:hypothetical protein